MIKRRYAVFDVEIVSGHATSTLQAGAQSRLSVTGAWLEFWPMMFDDSTSTPKFLAVHVSTKVPLWQLHSQRVSFGSFSTHLSEIEDQSRSPSAPVRKRRTKSGPGALRLAGLL